MGPHLFTIFINYNDLPEKTKNKCKLYADDCKLIGTVKDNSDLEAIQDDIMLYRNGQKHVKCPLIIKNAKLCRKYCGARVQNGL